MKSAGCQSLCFIPTKKKEKKYKKLKIMNSHDTQNQIDQSFFQQSQKTLF